MELKVNDVSFSYSSVPVLHDVSFELKDNELVSILGPNGVGKSTLIHCINKILSPTSGTVMIDGRDVSEIKLKELAKEIGYVPYSANDSFPLSVIDTVMIGRHPYSRWGTLDKDLDIVYETLRMLGISHLAMRAFNELSAGQHQKIVLARGLVQEPRVLLLDEPTSNLDIRHQIEVTHLLKELSREKNMLVIMISHDLNLAATYSDNVIMMSKGTIYDVGRPEDVITEESIKAVYNVNSEVIMRNGRPHTILVDDEFTEQDAAVPEGAIVTGKSHRIG